ncbi:MAG: thiamine phosphate synthase, partial [Chloroflexi bacterium]|nr:thiamine phosphate synthase [Chloroflexota bacterium]
MPAPMEVPCLCLVADTSVVGADQLAQRVSAAVSGGVGLVQLRAKELPGGQLLSLTSELKAAIGGRAALIVNERVDVAAAAVADGVQLGEEALPVTEARKLLPNGALIGRSVHSVEGAVRAEAAGADVLVVGTMFPTGSHPGVDPAGPGRMRGTYQRCSITLIGLGRLNPNNIAEVMKGGG